MKFSIIRPYLFTALLAVLIIGVFFQKYALQPNDYLYSNDGDGIKNYYTPAYYIRYDDNFRLSGMNYPYGEHVVYTDNQPLLSEVLKYLKSFGIPSEHYIVGITNVLILLSFIVCSLLMVWILKKTGLPEYYAIICGLLIAFLSPQVIVAAGCYALAYSAFVPLAWVIFIKFEEQRKNFVWPLLLFFTVLLAGFLHPYYFAMLALLVLTLVFVHFLQNKAQKSSYFLYGISLVAAVLPLVLFKVFIGLTDPELDRPENPWGFFAFRTTFEGVFLPNVGPFREVWHYYVNASKPWGAGYVYVGFPGLLVLLFSLVKIYNYSRKRQFSRIFKPVLPYFMRYSIWAGVLMLLFAMTIPFRWGLEFLVDLVPFLKQFRAMGRFGWGFYYIFTVFTAFYFYQIFRYFRMRINSQVAATMLTFVLLSWMLGAWSVMKHTRNLFDTIGSDNKLHEKNFPMYGQIKDDILSRDYQALMAFPFFLIGSEKLGYDGNNALNAKAMALSYHAHLPLVNVMLSRTSASKAFEKLEILNQPFLPKSYLSKIDNEKEILIMAGNELSEPEMEILKSARFLKEVDSVRFYSLVPAKLLQPTDAIVSDYKKKKDSLRETEGVWTLSRSKDFVYDSFNAASLNGPGFIGNGKAISNTGDKYKFVWEGSIPDAEKGKEYEISWWFYLTMEHAGFGRFYYTEILPSGESLERKEVSFRHNRIDVLGTWARIQHKFTLADAKSKIKIELKDEDGLVDELLIRPALEDMYTNIKEEEFFWNNYPIK